MSPKNLSVKRKIPKLINSKLNKRKINQIYKRFEKSLDINDNFIVAVSGGPDSLALAFLAKIYSIKKKITSKFLIVDHKLRKISTIEAKKVKKVLKQLSINAEILTWKGKKPSHNIQSLARNERYKLLFAKGDEYKINNILTGHHKQDLMENFLIRLCRGSGLKGLISFAKKSQIGNKNLFRPLLNEKKEDLIFVSNYVFNFFVEDQTNKDEKYLRIRIRKLIEQLKINGLDEKKFIKTIKNLSYSNDVIEFYVHENIKKNAFFISQNNRLILNTNFFRQPYEIIFRSLSQSIKKVGRKYYSVRGKKLDKIIRDIENNRLSKVTLGGCIIEKVSETVVLSKEN